MFMARSGFPSLPLFFWVPLWSLYFFSQVNGAAPYLEIPFDTTTTFGYDGPWHAVPVGIGSNDQIVNLFPGSQWAPTILSTSVCDGVSNCVSAAGGLYDYDSDTSTYPGTIGFTATGTNTVPFGTIFSAEGENFGQFAELRIGGGFSRVTIVNASVSRVDSVSLYYGRKKVGMSNGFLTMGAVDDIHVFGDYRAVIPLNNLAKTGAIASRSWGMHYPSAKLSQVPSLVWGGYDRARIAGPVQRADTDSNGAKKLDLVGISIDTAVGKSPFSFTRKDNLLVNPLSNSVLKVELESAIPYLLLPQETCDTIADELPVTLDRTTGFYLWQTSDPLYEKIVSSPAYLSFDFRISATQNFTIKVPFALLDLNMTAPLVTGTQPYFPCMAATLDESGSGAILGRAFYQAAFISQSYDTRKFWIAQAPGPGYSTADVRTIEKTALTLDSPVSGDDTWLSSWSSTWTVDPLEVTTEPSVPSETSATPDPSSPRSGLSTGAIAGIAAGIGAVVIILAAVLFMLWRRKRSRASLPDAPTPTLIPLSPSKVNYNNEQPPPPQQYADMGNAAQNQHWELPANEQARPQEVHELHS
ncbi:hypothetical protein TWF718_004282 [Orbilia javanica]|uniref:Peptidase A1 domain-containing protein n=1 Tax=Orbilia javanica TaxID=47235 RepID=A0AAN8NZD0_9PEZI